ncbi:MAG: tetratricopeptide repeat protein, partial [Candidatus Hodarchaeota archaeon]
CAVEIEPDYRNYRILALLYKGIIYVLMNSPEEAERTAIEMKNLIEKGMNLKRLKFYYYLMGLIELESENQSQAIEYFSKALDLLPVEFRYPQWNYELLFMKPVAMLYFRSGDLEKAQVEFETIINLKSGRLHHGDIYAESFYMLGKIFEQKGWVGKAIENYEKFLSLWKDADQGIPELEDAKKRLSELRKH